VIGFLEWLLNRLSADFEPLSGRLNKMYPCCESPPATATYASALHKGFEPAARFAHCSQFHPGPQTEAS